MVRPAYTKIVRENERTRIDGTTNVVSVRKYFNEVILRCEKSKQYWARGLDVMKTLYIFCLPNVRPSGRQTI